jgi:hypothetical protein
MANAKSTHPLSSLLQFRSLRSAASNQSLAFRSLISNHLCSRQLVHATFALEGSRSPAKSTINHPSSPSPLPSPSLYNKPLQTLARTIRSANHNVAPPSVSAHLLPHTSPPLPLSLSHPFQGRPANTCTQRPRHVPQAARHRNRATLRQMRRQMPRVRQLRAAHDTSAHLRRVQLRQLPEQVRGVRWRGHLRRLLLLRVHPP